MGAKITVKGCIYLRNKVFRSRIGNKYNRRDGEAQRKRMVKWLKGLLLIDGMS
jgi:hypothetical protein